jgi:Pentapeptide repeats (8 copies)
MFPGPDLQEARLDHADFRGAQFGGANMQDGKLYILDGAEGMQKPEAFWELLKLIFCKIEDERSGVLSFYATPSEHGSATTAGPAKARIQKVFEDKVAHRPPRAWPRWPRRPARTSRVRSSSLSGCRWRGCCAPRSTLRTTAPGGSRVRPDRGRRRIEAKSRGPRRSVDTILLATVRRCRAHDRGQQCGLQDGARLILGQAAGIDLLGRGVHQAVDRRREPCARHVDAKGALVLAADDEALDAVEQEVLDLAMPGRGQVASGRGGQVPAAVEDSPTRTGQARQRLPPGRARRPPAPPRAERRHPPAPCASGSARRE